MRLTARLIISLIVGIALVSFLFALTQVRGQKRALRNELEVRTEVEAKTLQSAVESMLGPRDRKDLVSLLEQFKEVERIPGAAVYDKHSAPLARTSGLAQMLPQAPNAVAQAFADGGGRGEFVQLGQTPAYVFALPLHDDKKNVVGALAIFHDAGYIEAQGARLWRATFLSVLTQFVVIALVTLLIVRWSFQGPISRMAKWMRETRAGGSSDGTSMPPSEELFQPLAKEISQFVRSLETARAAATEEARLREAAEAIWTPERLRVHVESRLRKNPLFVVSNREPYSHVHQGKSIEVLVPASGLVTSLEPVLVACDGTWIAHGGGDADQETVDEHDHLRVPPEDPHYTLRRVWLSKEEEQGYYYGFANEGLWPLCHIAFTRPVFRASDWEIYKRVNQMFARAALEEMKGTDRPAVLVQDYHFALVPRMIKEARPDARVAIFWHIPWPNPQAFGICPWQRELEDGLLGADLIGFHIQAHCNHFLETVDQSLESRIDWDRFSVTRRGHVTLVRRFPISVAMREAPPPPLETAEQREGAVTRSGSVYLERVALFKNLGVQATFMGVGVDRVDYTKGIIERFRGVERFLEKYPSYQTQFTLVQIGAPSRTHIKRYHDLMSEVELEAERINWRFQTPSWKPIVFLNRHHTHREIDQYYRAADLCLVTSLHDGMNLVAKEFIASRDDENGALILSRFTGAARELRDALVVNPYDTEQLAEAIRFALEMEPEDRRVRMARMRRVIKEHNIYRWAANLITELSEIRTETREKVRAN
jgi:trehalose-6-phosphate synthase/HAMP domain-containing protein